MRVGPGGAGAEEGLWVWSRQAWPLCWLTVMPMGACPFGLIRRRLSQQIRGPRSRAVLPEDSFQPCRHLPPSPGEPATSPPPGSHSLSWLPPQLWNSLAQRGCNPKSAQPQQPPRFTPQEQLAPAASVCLLLLAAAGWIGRQSPQGKERELRLEEDLA